MTGVVNCTDDRTATPIQGSALWSPDEQGRLLLHMTSAHAPSFNTTVLFEGTALKQLMETGNIEERAQQQGTLSYKEQQLRMRVVNGVLRVWDTLSLSSTGDSSSLGGNEGAHSSSLPGEQRAREAEGRG